jgi:hypothetical protein
MSMSTPVTVLGLTVALGCSLLAAAEPPAAREAPGKDQPAWKTLFDKKSLDGWKASDFFKPGKVQVKDEVIQLEKGMPMTGVTYARADFPKMDYEVTLEARKVAGEDFFATTTFPVGNAFCSLVVGGWGGTVVGLSSLNGSDASENETRKDLEFKTGQWYRVRIRVSAKRIEAWIDRDKVINVDTTDREISIRIECQASKPFGIATYRTTGELRDIRVRSLTEADKKAIREANPEKKD